ncbi:hypothetical protein C4561_01480 [candidate division WWE3 bacterium]|uniref:Uncharacterized protein n=1 Tax=candidate division WWE3 bacterium TaxID=2053526 RepID=A0A3A4ZF01_UNCKA|nr:MAG: hypothetical protein C4561_01480 [candidate division WWE3 bacterium]
MTMGNGSLSLKWIAIIIAAVSLTAGATTALNRAVGSDAKALVEEALKQRAEVSQELFFSKERGILLEAKVSALEAELRKMQLSLDGIHVETQKQTSILIKLEEQVSYLRKP